MSEELVQAARRGGVSRGLPAWDAFAMGFMNQGLTPSLVVFTSLGVGVYAGGNMAITVLLSALFAGVGMPLVWGVLGGSMPRSGGEYIYASRVLHPAVGIAQSFGGAAVWIMWIGILAPWVVDPGLTMLVSFAGATNLAEWVRQPSATFLLASLVNVAAFLLVAFRSAVLARVQTAVMAVGVGGLVVLILVLAVKAGDFRGSWDAVAAQYDSLDYRGFLAAVETHAGAAMPATWNWFDSLGAMLAGSWLFTGVYSMTFIAGEVRRPHKALTRASLLAVLAPAALSLCVVGALYRLDFDFLSSAFYADRIDGLAWGIEGFRLPFSTNLIGLAFIVEPRSWLGAIYALSYMAFALWWVVLSFLAFPRLVFAWGMDRLGPRWFTDISPRFSSPLKDQVLCLVFGEVGIAVYVFLIRDPLQGLVVTGLEVATVLGVTAVAALLLPYRRRVRGVWASSPHRTWRLFGLPAVSLGAVVLITYLAILSVALVMMPIRRDYVTHGAVFLAVVWALGLVWYMVWNRRRRTASGLMPPASTKPSQLRTVGSGSSMRRRPSLHALRRGSRLE